MAHIQSVEKIVSEFLVWKGFTNTLRSFENETRNDRTKHFRVDLILNSIQLAIASHDLNELREIWKTIETFFFTKLEQNYTDTLRKLESGEIKSTSKSFLDVFQLFYILFFRSLQSLSRDSLQEQPARQDCRILQQNGSWNSLASWMARLLLFSIL